MNRLILLVLLLLSVRAGAVTLAWNPNPETDILEYRVYIGSVSNDASPWFTTRTTDTQAVVQVGVGVFWAAVTAVNTVSEESAFSNWVQFTNNVTAWTNPFIQLVLTVRKDTGSGFFTIEATPDFRVEWKDLTNVITMGNGPWFFRVRTPLGTQTEAMASVRRAVSLMPPKVERPKRLVPTAGSKAGKRK